MPAGVAVVLVVPFVLDVVDSGRAIEGEKERA